MRDELFAIVGDDPRLFSLQALMIPPADDDDLDGDD